MDKYTPYETGLQELRRRIGNSDSKILELSNYRHQLLENIHEARQDGDFDALRADRRRILKQLDILALNTLGIPFTDLCDSPEGKLIPQLVLDELELPHKPTTFIGRIDELRSFSLALNQILDNQPSEGHKIFLLRGLGGMGKSTLLLEFVHMCQAWKDRLYWIYINWEKAGITASDGTPEMMRRLVAAFQQVYNNLHFAEFIAVEIKINKLRKQIDLLRAEFTGSSRNEFDSYLKSRLTTTEYESYSNFQRILSQAFVSDLQNVIRDKPVVLLFDTYELMWQFADEWVRTGLLKSLLSDASTKDRFLFVIAGRLRGKSLNELPSFGDTEILYRRDIKQFAGDYALYRSVLDNFIQSDIQKYFAGRFNIPVADNLADKIYKITSGIPLAIEILATILNEQENSSVQQFLEQFEEQLEDEIISSLTNRFLVHCFKKPLEQQNKELLQIYSITLLQESGSRYKQKQYRLLGSIWLKLSLVRSRDEVDFAITYLKEQYSFLFTGSSIHQDVRPYLRERLRRSKESSDIGKLQQICQAAKQICESKFKQTTQDLYAKYGQREADKVKYQILEWQCWLFNIVNYKLWLQEYDNVIELLIEHYIMGLQYGRVKLVTPDEQQEFHTRLLSLVKDDPILYSDLPQWHKSIIERLLNLKEWLSNEDMAAYKLELLNLFSKGQRPWIEMKIMESRAFMRIKEFSKALNSIRDIEEVYNDLKSNSIDIEQLATEFHALGRIWSQNTRIRSELNQSLSILEKAVRLNPKDANFRCTRANILVKLWRLEEAELEYYQAKRLGATTEAQIGLNKIARAKGRGQYSSKKQARILTTQASLLSSKGEFERAEQQFETAIRTNSTYVPAYIKLIHLLRNLGHLEKAKKLVSKLETSSDLSTYELARLYHAQAALYSAVENWQQAVYFNEKSLQLSPKYINAHAGLGRAYLYMGENKKSLITLEHAVNIKKYSTTPIQASLFWVNNSLGLAYMTNNHGDGAQLSFMIAEMLCNKYCELGSDSRSYHTLSQLGIAQLGQRKYQESLASFAKFSEDGKKAKGLLSELLRDIELIGKHDGTESWRKIYVYLLSF